MFDNYLINVSDGHLKAIKVSPERLSLSDMLQV